MDAPNTLWMRCKIESEGSRPRYQSDGAAGADLVAALGGMVWPCRRGVFPTGVTVEIPIGYEGQVRSRSGLAAQHGVMVLNSPGTIDSDYRGEIKVILANFGDEPYTVNPGDRIAQLVIAPVMRVKFLAWDKLADTARADGGLGSTGGNDGQQ